MLTEKQQSIADIIKRWPLFRHSKDITPHLSILAQFRLVTEEAGPKNANLLHATNKGWLIFAFFFYMLAFENKGLSLFKFLSGFGTTEQTYKSFKIIKSQLHAMLHYAPRIQEIKRKLDYKLFLIPLHLLDADAQSFTDIIKNYQQFGYYREL